jgi:hypothetical protein
MSDQPHAVPEADIVQSECFRAINLLIDELAGEMQWRIGRVKTLVGEAFGDTNANFVRVRTSQEPGNSEHPLPAAPYHFKDIAELAGEITKIENQISQMQRFKLRLLNDYDFTHGDDSLQRAVFAPDLSPDTSRPGPSRP